MLRRRLLLIVTTPLLLVGLACSGEAEGTLEIDAMVSLCLPDTPCTSLAASGATFAISTGDAFVIKRGALSKDGTFAMTVEPGRYSVRVVVDGLEPVKGSITVSEGGAGTLSLMLTANVKQSP